MFHKILPYSIAKLLWGDRKKFGLIPRSDDNDWKIWREKSYTDFYPNTQQKGIGGVICRIAYPILRRIAFQNKVVFEVGPGMIRHLDYINDKPACYYICDVEPLLLDIASAQLRDAGISSRKILLDGRNNLTLPLPDESVDIIISFNSLEHLYPLDDYLSEFKRILKKGGVLVGSIPCEGGLTWGLGRFFTTRRYATKKYGINYDKIICWEHPNFANFILTRLSAHLKKEYLRLHPIPFFSIDYNLVALFFFRKSKY